GTAAAGLPNLMRDGKSQRQTAGRKPQPAQAVGAKQNEGPGFAPAFGAVRGAAGRTEGGDSPLPRGNAHSAAAGADIPAWHPAPPAGRAATEPGTAPPACQGPGTMRQTTARQQGPALQKGAATENLQEKNTMSKQQPAPAAPEQDGVPQADLER